MRCLILMHSSTGNTRVVTQYARRFLQARGVQCELHMVGRHPGPVDLTGVDLLGVAFPVMYFHPTLAMKAAVAAMENLRPGLPAFVLSTAAGDPGAALHVMVEQLEERGCLCLEAHWVLCPSNYPIHRGPLDALERTPVVRRLHGLSRAAMRRVWRRWPSLRPVMALAYKDAMIPVELDRRWLDEFLDTVLARQRDAEAGRPVPRPDLERHTHGPLIWSGRMTPPEKVAGMIGLSVAPERCTACGLCTSVCPADCVLPDDHGVPRFGAGCTGCYACYNACEEGAISAVGTPHGVGRYPGPPSRMRELFRKPGT